MCNQKVDIYEIQIICMCKAQIYAIIFSYQFQFGLPPTCHTSRKSYVLQTLLSKSAKFANPLPADVLPDDGPWKQIYIVRAYGQEFLSS